MWRGRTRSLRSESRRLPRPAGRTTNTPMSFVHRARKTSKRHRYVVELAQPVLGTKAEKIVARRKKLQDVLGDYQDSHVASAFIRELGARVGTHEGQNGFTYGVLLGIERQRLQQLHDVLANSKPGKAETLVARAGEVLVLTRRLTAVVLAGRAGHVFGQDNGQNRNCPPIEEFHPHGPHAHGTA